MLYPHMRQAILDLAPTTAERRAILKCSERMHYYYMTGRHIPSMAKIREHPSLRQALARDLEMTRSEPLIPDIGGYA